MKKVLAISGSPRRQGNSEILLDEAISGAKSAGAQTEKIILNELKITPCQECGGCDKSGVCVIDDDMREVYKKLDEADIIILAAPIFFSGISAQAKAMIDRCQCCWIRKYILKASPHAKKRKGVFISVRGQAGLNVFETAAKPVKAMFASLDIEYACELFVDHIDVKGEMGKNKKALEDAYQLGYEVVIDAEY